MHDDESLYLRLNAGDARAFELLYDRYERPLFAFILSYVGRERGEEILQEVFMRLLKESDLDFSQGGLKAWLYCVARNRCLNHLTQQRNRKRLLEENPPEISVDPDASEAEKNLLLLGDAARALPPALYTVYQMRRVGMSYQQIADELGVPIGTVKSRMNQILLRLRQSMLAWREA